MRFLFIIFSLFAFANAQYYNVDLNNGIVEFTDTTSSYIKYSFTAQEISYREVGSNNFDICDNAFCNGFAMKEIANFTNRSYFLDSLNYWQSISASSFSGLWQTINGYYEPKTSKPFNFTYQGYSLIVDSNEVSMNKDSLNAKVNSNGFVLPKIAVEPSGEPGGLYFNQNTTEFRAYNGSEFRTLVSLSTGSGSPIGVVTPAHEGIMFWDTGTNHIYISVGTTSADWVKLN